MNVDIIIKDLNRAMYNTLRTRVKDDIYNYNYGKCFDSEVVIAKYKDVIKNVFNKVLFNKHNIKSAELCFIGNRVTQSPISVIGYDSDRPLEEHLDSTWGHVIRADRLGLYMKLVDMNNDIALIFASNKFGSYKEIDIHLFTDNMIDKFDESFNAFLYNIDMHSEDENPLKRVLRKLADELLSKINDEFPNNQIMYDIQNKYGNYIYISFYDKANSDILFPSLCIDMSDRDMTNIKEKVKRYNDDPEQEINKFVDYYFSIILYSDINTIYGIRTSHKMLDSIINSMYAGKILLKEYKTISKKYMHELYDIYKDFLNARASEMKSVERLATDPSWFFEDMVTQLSYITANNSEKITTFFLKRGD